MDDCRVSRLNPTRAEQRACLHVFPKTRVRLSTSVSLDLGLAPRNYRIGTVQNELYVGQQKILFDREATAALYRQTIMVPGADRCGCISCKNFVAQRGTAFPEKFVQLLKELGADPLKEWEFRSA
jgi:hypothetical protein